MDQIVQILQFLARHSQEILTFIGDFVAKIVFPGVALWIAARGLRTWQDQLHGTAEYDIARRILRALLEVRDAMRYARLEGSLGGEGDPQPGQDAMVAAYDARFQAVQKARRELEIALLDGEALWGDELKKPTDKLNEHLGDLFIAIRHFVASRLNERDSTIFNHERDGAALWGGEGDNFDNELLKIIKAYDGLVRPHLNRKK